MLTLRSRFWLLTTVMGLWKLHLGTLPNLRANARAVASKSPSHGDLALREVKEQIEDAEWTNRKYLADLVFVCEYGRRSSIAGSKGPDR